MACHLLHVIQLRLKTVVVILSQHPSRPMIHVCVWSLWLISSSILSIVELGNKAEKIIILIFSSSKHLLTNFFKDFSGKKLHRVHLSFDELIDKSK